jgi:sugar fermentation stimulation protein A
MRFTSPLIPGRLLRRYKRFLADVRLDDGREVTAHTANTGAMLGCSKTESRVWLSIADNPKRKYPYTWELVEVVSSGRPTLIGINTQLSNHLVEEAILAGRIAELSGYTLIESERPYGQKNSRIDLLLSAAATPCCYVEVKNVTLADAGVGMFPDAVTSRGAKHLHELQWMASQGQRAVMLYCVQREDVRVFQPAVHIDPNYAQLLQLAAQNGVEMMAYRCSVSLQGIELIRSLPVLL